MANDTREGFAAASMDSQNPQQQSRKELQDTPAVRTSQSPNVMPGGTEHTAGGQAKPVTAIDAAKSIKLGEFTEIHKKPCVRDAFLTGIPSGAAAGVLWAILGAPVKKAANWAAGTFCILSFISYEYCQVKRGMEKDGMRRAVQLMDEKRADREERMKFAREERRKAKEEADRKEEEKKKSRNWWKFW